MKVYTVETKTADVVVDPATGAKARGESYLVAKVQFSGPENAAEFKAWAATNATFQVTGIAVGRNGAADKEISPKDVENFAAWEYGANLKANQIGRDAADIVKAVTDHVLSIGRATTDLDAMAPADLVKALNGIESNIALGIDFGGTNVAKVNDKIEKSIAAGVMHRDKAGALVAGKGNGSKK